MNANIHGREASWHTHISSSHHLETVLKVMTNTTPIDFLYRRDRHTSSLCVRESVSDPPPPSQHPHSIDACLREIGRWDHHRDHINDQPLLGGGPHLLPSVILRGGSRPPRAWTQQLRGGCHPPTGQHVNQVGCQCRDNCRTGEGQGSCMVVERER